MTPQALAALHARCFTDAPRPWNAAEFTELLEAPGGFLVAQKGGFALGRIAGPEAELLTLAVAPEARRRGLGRALLAAFEAEARARGATEAYLEVAETNGAARALYAAAGYLSAGFRRDYYEGAGSRRIGALVLKKSLAA